MLYTNLAIQDSKTPILKEVPYFVGRPLFFSIGVMSGV